MEKSITADYAFVKGHVADEMGNVVFNKTALNFNIDVAMAGKTCIVEVEEIVPVGEIPPHKIDLSHVYVNKIVKGTDYKKPIERPKFSTPHEEGSEESEEDNLGSWNRLRIAKRAAQEINDGDYVNLGIGIPVLVPHYLSKDVTITLHSENGMLGLGDYPLEENADPDLINASKESATIIPGGSYMKSSDSFTMVRGGHLDISILGGMEVSERGDLSNWMIPGKLIKGMGGAMDLVAGCKKIVVGMDHCNKAGKSKIMARNDIPLTGIECVDVLVTEKAVFKWNRYREMILTEVASDSSVEDIRANTDADFEVASRLESFD